MRLDGIILALLIAHCVAGKRLIHGKRQESQVSGSTVT